MLTTANPTLEAIDQTPRVAARWPEPDRVVVINDASVMRGGATGMALASARLLKDRGVPVTFLTGDHASDIAPADQGIEFVALGGTHILSAPVHRSMIDGLYNTRAADFVARWIRAHDTPRTVYHLHGWSKVLSPSVFAALRQVGPRLVISAHDFFLVCPNGGYFDFASMSPCDRTPLGLACLSTNCDRRNYLHKLWRSTRQGVRRMLTDIVPGRVGAVVAVHEGMLDLLVRGGVDPATLRTLRNPAMPWRSERVAAESNRIFVFVGRLEPDKGAELFAAAARRAGVLAQIIGGGPEGGRIADAYPEVDLTGWKSREEIGKLIGAARALVMTTRSREAFGIVALEALTSGVPVVLSNSAMLASEIVEKGMGLACDPHDEAALAGLFSRLAGDDALVAAMSRCAFAEARQMAPTPGEWIDALLGIYGDLLETAR